MQGITTQLSGRGKDGSLGCPRSGFPSWPALALGNHLHTDVPMQIQRDVGQMSSPGRRNGAWAQKLSSDIFQGLEV